MYVRDAKKREEVWLLDHIEAMGLDETAFRSRDYVVAVDETSNAKAGFGRVRVHTDDDAGEVCELTSIGVREEWRNQGVGAHVIERLVEYASDAGFERVYSLTGEADYLSQFGFRRIDESTLPAVLSERLATKRSQTDPDAVPLEIDCERFVLPDRLREAFKGAAEKAGSSETDATAEDFGIDSESATYKYDTGR